MAMGRAYASPEDRQGTFPAMIGEMSSAVDKGCDALVWMAAGH